MHAIKVLLVIAAAVSALDVITTSIGSWRVALGRHSQYDVGTAHEIALRSTLYAIGFILAVGFLGLLLK